MLIKNVYYQEEPEKVEIRRYGRKATVVFATDIRKREETEEEDGGYIAGKVYTIDVDYTKKLRSRVEENYDEWLLRAKKSETKETTLEDVVEALETLTDVVMGAIEYGEILV